MHTLSFTLSLEGVIRIHDAVLCLAKFSEVVSLEAREDKVRDAFMRSRIDQKLIYSALAGSHCPQLF